MRKSRRCGAGVSSIFLDDSPLKMTHHESMGMHRYCSKTLHHESEGAGWTRPGVERAIRWTDSAPRTKAAISLPCYLCQLIQSVQRSSNNVRKTTRLYILGGAINSLSAWACHSEFCFGLWQDAMMHAKMSLKLRVSHEDSFTHQDQGQSF